MGYAQEIKWVLGGLAHVATKDVQSARHVPGWFRSLIPTVTPFKDRMPWMTYGAINWLDSYLQPSMRVFEFGSGGSTLYFAKRVKKIVSVDHDEPWLRILEKELKKEGVKNCDLLFVTPKKAKTKKKYSYTSLTSTEPQCKHLDFSPYVKSIDKYPDNYFDVVVVDGRARASCAYRALSKIKPGGYLLFDNSERKAYQVVMPVLDKMKRTDFFGIGPYRSLVWQTSVWQKPVKGSAKKKKKVVKKSKKRTKRK